jgi:hypothetical protein
MFMGLNASKPPKQGLQIVRDALGDLITNGPSVAGIIAESMPSQVSIAAPHPVYFVALTDVAEGNLLSVATLTGWRYIMLEGDQTVGAANLRVKEDGEELQFSHISYGPFVNSTVEGIGRAESLPEVLSNDYELRLLDIPSLYVVSLWLHGNEDRLIPLPPTNQALEPYATYSGEEMAAALKGPAIERLNSEESAPAPG